MSKVFNVTAVCRAEENYMVDITKRVESIKALVDDGKYFLLLRLANTEKQRLCVRWLKHYKCI